MDRNNVVVRDTRDDRFKQILREQLGENGIPLMVNQAFVFLLALILVVAVAVGMFTTQLNVGREKTLKGAALLV